MDKKNIQLIIGKNLKCIRNNLGLYQSDFCKHCGVEQSQYSKIERGIAALTVKQLYDIADNLSVDPIELQICRDICFLP